MVVVLIIIIIVACTAIFFLLKEEKKLDEENGHRKKSFPIRSLPNIQTSSRDPPPNRIPLSKRLLSLFRSRALDTRSKEGGHTEYSGWMQARSGGDWDFEPVPSVRHESASPSRATPLSPPTLPMPVSRNQSTSNWSVRHALNAIRGTPNAQRNSISSQAMLPNLQPIPSSPTYSPAESPLPVRTLSPASDGIPEGPSINDEIRQYSTSSGVMQTLPGGTKFIEGL